MKNKLYTSAALMILFLSLGIVSGIVPSVAASTRAAAITLNPSTASQGGLLTVSGAGFRAYETVHIYFLATPRTVTSARATRSGLLPSTDITVPYNLSPGAHVLVAYGVISRRAPRAVATVQALRPGISIAPTTASPGTTVTVNGHGFASNEQVTLALNGSSLASSPSTIQSTNGGFSATFVAPRRLIDGLNTVSAVGNKSRVAAGAALQGVLPLSSQYYFAGALNTATEHSLIDIVNTNRQPARVALTFFFNNGTSGIQTYIVPPTSTKRVSAADYNYPAGTFGLFVRANRRISTQITLARDGRDGDALVGATGLASTWYLAEGYTGLSFHESVSILNPDNTRTAHVQLHLLRGANRRPAVVALSVPPHTNLVENINRIVPAQAVSVIAISDLPVAVERTMTFGPGAYGLTTRTGAEVPATSWIFAEGTTTGRFQTFLTVLNPNGTPARTTASFFGANGGGLGDKTFTVGPFSRTTIKLNNLLSASGIASIVTSDHPIVVERPEYFGSPNDAGIPGSDVFGLNGASTRWTFPGGDTRNNSDYLLIYNPSPAPLTIDAKFYGTAGTTLVRRLVAPASSRYTVNVNTLIGGFSPLHGVVLQSINAAGFVAEETIFSSDYGQLRSTEGLAQ